MNAPPPLRLHHEIETPRPLYARHGRVTVTGWCLAEGHVQPPAVRLVTAAGTLAAGRGEKRADVSRLFPAEPAALECGFLIEGTLPPGVYLARFEARLPDGGWHVFRQYSLAVEAAPLAAEVDTPVRTGTISGRIKIGGWALHPAGSLQPLHLRYGHREVPARLGVARRDVSGLFPASPHAAAAGFISEDFLVAGRGPLRLKARLAGGSVAIVRTLIEINVPTDENHGPELNLAAPRIPLPGYGRREPGAPPPRAKHPLNILFVLYGDFSSNSALHVAGLANELAAAGHDCVVAVPRDEGTLRPHAAPAFRSMLHTEAVQAGVVFTDGRGPAVIHAWTTRENVRRVCTDVRARQGGRLVVHLEDNERQILALTLRRAAAELEALSDAELDRLVPPDLSHPRRSREFLAQADGITVITERLREFAPEGRPLHTIWPAADARYFYPRSHPAEFRRRLDVPPGTTVLFYHGNVHASNAAEVRELYAAVLQLNRDGLPVTLIRTGLDRVDFLESLAPAVTRHVLSLGQILHHRHLPPLMALADIFVQPGEPDGFNDYRFPSKLPEFFALGRPVVLPRTNLGLVTRHGVDAYVLDRADAAGIAAAIQDLRRDRVLYERLSRGAAEFAAAHFSWRRSAEALEMFYQSLSAGTVH